MKKTKSNLARLVKAYLIAKIYVINSGFSDEIDWQDSIDFASIDSRAFLEQYTWVVLATGMNDKVVSRVFPKIKTILREWSDLGYILENKNELLQDILKVFNNKKKINSLFYVIELVNNSGFSFIKEKIKNGETDYLRTLPFIGEKTCYHLAKNLGLHYAKPDRHLQRISDKVGYITPNALCQDIAEITGEKIEVVDLVLWRYATLDRNYLCKVNRLNSFR